MDHALLEMHTHHNPYLVVLSYIIATISAYASIDLAKRVNASKSNAKIFWLVSGGATLGTGIWSMHFIAMLSFHFPVPVFYNTFLVVISVFIAIIGCYSGFYLLATKDYSISRFLIAGIIMGSGIATMHYVGMIAIEPIIITYDPLLFVISVFIGIFASWVALWLGFLSPYARKRMSWQLKVCFSLIMAIAITGMHYTGMAAADFSNSPMIEEHTSSMNTSLLAWIVAVVTLLIFALFFFSITFDRIWRKQGLVQSVLLDSVADGIAITDQHGKILHSNKSFGQMMIDSGITSQYTDMHNYHPTLFIGSNEVDDYQFKLGTYIFEVKRRPIQDEEMNHHLWFISDITERNLKEQQIVFMAYHDSLTQLPNRYKMQNTLEDWIESAQEIGCIKLNIDRMKFANDTLGHKSGDELLKSVCKKLRSSLRTDDFLARVEGDEFVILIKDDRVKSIPIIAAACVDVIQTPVVLNKSTITITASAGTCTYPDIAASAEELIQYADWAMLESKKNGKNQTTTFNIAMQEQHNRILLIEDALATAIENGQLHLLYQPKITLPSEQIESVEALLRWSHPSFGSVSPVEFIPIAEEKGFIHKLGDWVVRAACLQWSRWIEEQNVKLVIAVNIAPIQLIKEDFYTTLLKILEETHMDPHYLELEITESSSFVFEEKTNIMLKKIRNLGIRISLDDFGTGYSTFSVLKQLPIDTLKIDRSFLKNLLRDVEQQAIVRSIIQLGHNLKFDVLVEGVESIEEVEWLKNEDCDYIQGFFYSKPQLPADLVTLLKHERIDTVTVD